MAALHTKVQGSHLIQRSLIFLGLMIIVITLSLLHGFLGGERTIRMLEQMLDDGELSGKFWRVTTVDQERITATKYQKKITLIHPPQFNIQEGDHVSFIARASRIDAPNHHVILKPVEIRIHGKSRFKFMLSFISVFVVLMMCFRFIRFDRKTISLTFRDENDSCRMD